MQAGQCWQCESPAENNLFCKFCNSLQRPLTDYYAFFGLEHKLNIDNEDLQRRFYQLSKLLHPDRYTRRAQRERDYSLEATAILNDGYRVLRDPVKRAEYILAEQGFEVGEQRAKDVPPELLEEVFELNMALEELVSGASSVRPQLEEARSRFRAMRREADERLGDLYKLWDASGERDSLVAVRGELNRRKYIENLITEVEKALSA
ncbi:MAG: Fe-S protein assembly co-chaperone HscB [Acidobacteriia bacterium]|nr:Fe-S protein assembly co-chaperone HscB [Terriglobia bacterium]